MHQEIHAMERLVFYRSHWDLASIRRFRKKIMALQTTVLTHRIEKSRDS